MINVRYGMFETNSSSTHAIIMCTDEDYKKLLTGELMIAGWDCPCTKEGRLVNRSEVYDWFWFKFEPNNREYIEEEYDLNNEEEIAGEIDNILAAEGVAYTLDTYGGEQFEHYDTSFTTPGGETVHAFGYYGQDW